MNVEIELQDRVREIAQRFQLAQDAVGLVVLVPAAWARAQTARPLNVAVAVLELGAIVVAVASAARELRGRDAEKARLDWTNLFMAAVLLTEYGIQRAAGGKLVSPVLLTALSALLLGILPHLRTRLALRRRLTIDDAGINVRISPLRRLRLAWADVQHIEEDDRSLAFVLHGGRRRRLSLRRFRNGDEIRAAVAEAAAHIDVAHIGGRTAR